MGQKVILDEGGSVSVHTRIKDMCKSARNRQGLTNQDICNLISERFGIEDFSINTVNNFFSERSKATTIYTTGYICAVLGISIDAVFGIEHTVSTEEEREFVAQMAELKHDLRLKEQEIDHMQKTIEEKNIRISEAGKALEHYRKEVEADRKKVQPWVAVTLFCVLIAVLILIGLYIVYYDIGNPDYGIFSNRGIELFSRIINAEAKYDIFDLTLCSTRILGGL